MLSKHGGRYTLLEWLTNEVWDSLFTLNCNCPILLSLVLFASRSKCFWNREGWPDGRERHAWHQQFWCFQNSDVYSSEWSNRWSMTKFTQRSDPSYSSNPPRGGWLVPVKPLDPVVVLVSSCITFTNLGMIPNYCDLSIVNYWEMCARIAPGSRVQFSYYALCITFMLSSLSDGEWGLLRLRKSQTRVWTFQSRNWDW